MHFHFKEKKANPSVVLAIYGAIAINGGFHLQTKQQNETQSEKWLQRLSRKENLIE